MVVTEKHITVPKRANTPETQLYVKIHSQPDNKHGERDTIILIPGGPGNDHSMYDAEPFSIAKCFLKKANVVLFDPRGCGKSEISNPRHCHLEDYVADIEALRAALELNPKNTIVFGQSYGAIAATAYACTYPTHLKKLLLIGGAVDATFLSDIKTVIEAIGTEEQKHHTQQLITGSMGTSLKEVDSFLKVMSPLYSESFKENTNEVAEIPYNVDILNEGWRHSLSKLNLADSLEKINCPTLILYGKQDHFFSEKQINLLHKKIKNSLLKTYDSCGHLLWIDQWQRFVEDATLFLVNK